MIVRWGAADYQLSDDHLTLQRNSASFVIEQQRYASPEATPLPHRSAACSARCEAEGFRKITYCTPWT
jgi:aminopeptidase N